MFRRQAYYIASVVFIVIGFVYFIITINQPCIGLDFENDKGQWLVTVSDPEGEGYQAGVRVGDIVIKINEDVPSNYPLFKKWRVAEGASSIEVRRFNQPIDYYIKLPTRSNWQNKLKEIPLHILGFVFWLLGFMTWLKRPFLAQARAIFWLNWIIGLVIVFSSASGRCLFFAKELCYISMSLVPVFLINLISVFPKENRNRANRLSIHTFAITAIVLMTLTVLQSIGIINNASSLLMKIILLTDMIALLLVLGNLGSLIMLPKDNPEKNQAGILFLGMVIGFFPFVILTAVPLLFGFHPMRYFDFSSLFLSVVPVAWYYVIVNRYLPDSRRLFETIISFFISGVVISFILSYVFYFFKLVKTLNLEVYLVSLSLTMLFMACIYFMRVIISMLLKNLALFEGKQGFRERVQIPVGLI